MNFNTDRIVIVCFNRGSGGKFLINCLGLSNDAVLQDKKLAELQLKRNFSPIVKADYLLKKIKKVKNEWNDLGLGCKELFNYTSDIYNGYTASTASTIPQTEIVTELCNRNNKFFFLVAHDYSYAFYFLIRIWKNAKVIIFLDDKDFIKGRAKKFQREHLKSLSNECHKEMQERTNPTFYWDTNWYFSKKETIKHIQELYKQFNLEPVDQVYLEEYYNAWIDKLREVQ